MSKKIYSMVSSLLLFPFYFLLTYCSKELLASNLLKKKMIFMVNLHLIWVVFI